MFINGQGADLSAGPESPMVAVADYPDPAIAEEMARTLLGNASDPNAKRKDGKSVLQIAVARGNMRVAEILIHRGAKLDADVPGADKIERMYGRSKHEDMNGQPQSVINQFVTIAHANFDTVKQMHKQSSALLSTRATWDETAIEAAAHMGIVPMTAFLADAGADVSICTAALLGDAKRVRSLLDADRNRLRERGAHDFALLNYTMFAEERAEIASMLLEADASANPFVMGASPLHMAAGKGYLEIARLLVDHHADVNATFRTRKGPGPTPLAVAIQKKQDKMAAFLKDRGGITG
jgi:ankyrin repeat protein